MSTTTISSAKSSAAMVRRINSTQFFVGMTTLNRGTRALLACSLRSIVPIAVRRRAEPRALNGHGSIAPVLSGYGRHVALQPPCDACGEHATRDRGIGLAEIARDVRSGDEDDRVNDTE